MQWLPEGYIFPSHLDEWLGIDVDNVTEVLDDKPVWSFLKVADCDDEFCEKEQQFFFNRNKEQKPKVKFHKGHFTISHKLFAFALTFLTFKSCGNASLCQKKIFSLRPMVCSLHPISCATCRQPTTHIKSRSFL